MVIPADVRAAIVAHAQAELPNEACGLLLLDGDVAVEYVAAENASPVAVLLRAPSSTRSSGPTSATAISSRRSSTRTSRRRRARRAPTSSGSGSGATCPYVIYSVARDELAAWRIGDGITAIPVSAR